MRIKQSLIKLIPPAYYSNGKESNCAVYRICNMFDINSQSFKEPIEERNMNKKIKGEDYILHVENLSVNLEEFDKWYHQKD